ncbi:MAG: hypothetical protein OCD02_19430 [Spirochaetaceae bacterium]
MNNIGEQLLKRGNFPKESKLKDYLGQIKSGNLKMSLSSFEEIYNMTPKGIPFPIGCINFDDRKNRFVISWVEDFSKINLKEIEEYTIKIRNYPTEKYPVLSLLIGIHNGKIDPDTKEDLWYYTETHLDLSMQLTRIKLYQLLNSEEVLFCLFDVEAENLDSFGFSLNKKELKMMMDEIKSSLAILEKMNLLTHIRDFSEASSIVSKSFLANGLPKTKEALNIYLKRKELEPKPNKHNWDQYLTI